MVMVPRTTSLGGLVLRDFDTKQNPQVSVQSPEETTFSSGAPEVTYNCELLTAKVRGYWRGEWQI